MNGREVITSSNYLIFCIIKFRKKEISASGDIALCKLSALSLNVLCEILFTTCLNEVRKKLPDNHF